MRMIFGVLSLLLALAVIGFLAKKQMGSINEIRLPDVSAAPRAPGISPATPAAEPDSTASAIPSMSPSINVQQQSQQIQQQVQQQLRAATEATLQQARPAQDEK